MFDCSVTLHVADSVLFINMAEKAYEYGQDTLLVVVAESSNFKVPWHFSRREEGYSPINPA